MAVDARMADLLRSVWGLWQCSVGAGCCYRRLESHLNYCLGSSWWQNRARSTYLNLPVEYNGKDLQVALVRALEFEAFLEVTSGLGAAASNCHDL